MPAKVGSTLTRTAQAGYSILRAPGNCTGASAGGTFYNVEDDGCVCVPTALIGDLLAVGFVDTGGAVTATVTDATAAPAA